ncbi:MAG: hypothetical protein GQ474_07900 [Sulfurimonas sp.]|nr:hypothetical protein [Sulfurimonas sp.]
MNRGCNTCSHPLIVNFNWSEADKHNRTYRCTSCKNTRQRAYYAANKEARNKRSREYYEKNKTVLLKGCKYATVKRKYGLSEEAYHKLMDDAVCYVCKTSEDLCIDHCHTSGKVRGVLCRKCNMALGLVRDDKRLLNKMIKYLKEST